MKKKKLLKISSSVIAVGAVVGTIAVTVLAVFLLGASHKTPARANLGLSRDDCRKIDELFVGFEGIVNGEGKVVDMLDPVNGEHTLKIEEKANVLANICENEQKLTILEIVPYSLMAEYPAFIPSEEEKKLIEEYAPDLYKKYGVSESEKLILADENGIQGSKKNSSLYSIEQDVLSGNCRSNVIASTQTPIIIEKDGTGYNVNMPQTFINNQFFGHTNSSLFQYYADGKNVELITLSLADMRANGEDLYSYLYGRTDPIDIIVISGYGKNYYDIYRNIFFKYGADYAKDPVLKAKMVDFIYNGKGADEFPSGVFDETGREYKVSELEAQKIWYDNAYSFKDGNKQSADFTFDEAKLLINYVYTAVNRNYNRQKENGEDDQQKISTIVQAPFLGGGRQTCMSRDGVSYNTNVAKLWFMLCKFSDQDETRTPLILENGIDQNNVTEEQKKNMIYANNRYFERKTLNTYYSETPKLGDSNFFVLRNEFFAKDEDGYITGWKNDLWPVKEWNNLTINEYYGMNKQEMIYALRNINDGGFALYNGSLTMYQGGDKDLMYFGDSVSISDDDTHITGYRLGNMSNVTNNGLVGYLFGVDDSDFVSKPVASFEDLEAVSENDETLKNDLKTPVNNEYPDISPDEKLEGEVNLKVTSKAGRHIVYLDAARFGDSVKEFSFTAVGEDSDGELTDVKLEAFDINDTEQKNPLKIWTGFSGNGNRMTKDLTFSLDSNTDIYEKIKGNTVYFKVTASKINSTSGLTMTGVAYLNTVYSKIFDLD